MHLLFFLKLIIEDYKISTILIQVLPVIWVLYHPPSFAKRYGIFAIHRSIGDMVWPIFRLVWWWGRYKAVMLLNRVIFIIFFEKLPLLGIFVIGELHHFTTLRCVDRDRS